MDEHYNRLRTLQARYVERYLGMGMDRTETGTLELAKPGKMRWTYDKPAGKLFVMDGKFGWSYAPGDGQVQRIAAKKLDDLRSPLRFLLGHTQLAKELDNLLVLPEEGGFRISGVPKGGVQRIVHLVLHVDQTGKMLRMRINDTDGGITEFVFSDIKENAPIPAGEFVFAVPAGVGVVDGLPPI